MDPRTTPFSGRIAHISLKGQVSAPLTEGEDAQITVPVVDLLDKPRGARERQLLLGTAVTVIDRAQGFAFVQSRRDDYCGWIDEASIGPWAKPTHWVTAPGSHFYAEPVVQAPTRAGISLGSRLTVTGSWGAWANTAFGFIPMCHLHPIDQFAQDHVIVAESLLGTPYLWGGNSRFGIDCSGLVQLALNATGRDCPGDSDMQMALGRALTPNETLKRGDLVFWKGHVAIVVDHDLLIHANGYTMAVSYEGINEAIARIANGGGGLVLARQRL